MAVRDSLKATATAHESTLAAHSNWVAVRDSFKAIVRNFTCDVDIDSVIASVGCANAASVQIQCDGIPTTVRYDVWDAQNNLVYTQTTTSLSVAFVLPSAGVFYGMVTVSCGARDKDDGDDDEDYFELVNSAPVADFDISSSYTCVGGNCNRTISTHDYSGGDASLTYSWRVKDLFTGAISTYTSQEPQYAVGANHGLSIDLTVIDTITIFC